jgi:hypothetical protein
MTDKLEIKVGQRWITTHGSEVFIIADNAQGDFPFVGQYGVLGVDMWNAAGELGAIDEEGELRRAKAPNQEDLVSLLPPIVKREVALWSAGEGHAIYAFDAKGMSPPQHWRQVSEPLTIEFTLLSGESA